MTSGDGRVTRAEFLAHVRQTEPELEQWYNMLYDTFDMDGDHHLDLHDFVNLYLNMDPERRSRYHHHPLPSGALH